MDLGLAGRRVVVTGGSSGIGFETARLLLDEGALVTICARDTGRLAAAEADLDSDDLHAVSADVLDASSAASVIESAVDRFGGLDGVAAIAGRGRTGSLLELDPVDVIAEVSDKLAATLNIVQPAVPALIATAGSIVGLTAPTAATPDPAMGAIGTGRAALDNALRELAVELAPAGVRVNAVGVGIIDTPRQRARHEASGSCDEYAQWLAAEANGRSVPLGRAGLASEVAAAICWLLSPIASYTTGAVVDVTGGHASR